MPLEAIPLAKQGTESEKVWLHYGDVNSFNKMHFLNQCLVGTGGCLKGGPVVIIFGELG